MSIPSTVSRFFEDGLGFKNIFQNICMSLLSPGLPRYPHGDTPPRFPTVFLVRVVKTTIRATASNKAPRKGTFVRRINQKDIIENLTIRTSLEGLAARLAADHFSREDAEETESIVLKMKDAAIERDFGSYLKYNSKFHNTFINASGNQTLIKILEDLRIQTIWYRFMYEYERVA